ncbi:hypothetical protein [Fodinicola feengrottensis]|uniref:Uncharacterized protein n=1 Tax=Fodinicola feengrottensis TaxID=435914 RepID=A0ABN2FTC6_9ACTN|nr:hypothetical protein [Fodinicola feengrottensis]
MLLDPARLDRACGGHAAGRDVLSLFDATDLGERVVRDGVALPMSGVDTGYYTVIVRHADDAALPYAPRFSSPGWVLGTESGYLVFCGAGYLTRWDPRHPKNRAVGVPGGWYEVEVRGYSFRQGSDDAAYEFILTPVPTQPALAARRDQNFAVLNPS